MASGGAFSVNTDVRNIDQSVDNSKRTYDNSVRGDTTVTTTTSNDTNIYQGFKGEDVSAIINSFGQMFGMTGPEKRSPDSGGFTTLSALQKAGGNNRTAIYVVGGLAVAYLVWRMI